MICRHHAGDPACGSTGGGWKAAEYARETERGIRESEQKKTQAAKAKITELEGRIAAMTPDPSVFDLEDIRVIGTAIVAKVRFPNCSSCSYEGNKVLVYEGVSALDVAKWRKLDPHFREQPKGPRDSKVAPPPAARFPASKEGWERAIQFARLLDGSSSKSGMRGGRGDVAQD
jgi:hypothetical protein